MSTRLITTLLLTACLASAAEPDLVAHWTFDEGRGNLARDVTGRGHDATLQNTTWVPSPRGMALKFDSKEDRADYGGLESMNLSGDLTLAVWVQADGSQGQGTYRLIFGDTGLGVERNLSLGLGSYDVLRFEWADGRQNASLLAPATLLNGSWQQVVVSADSTHRRIAMYVDAQPVAQMRMPLPISHAPTKQRSTGWFYNGWFKGQLDDLRLYSRAFSPDEVKALFESQADVQVSAGELLYDPGQATPRALAALRVRNWAKQPRTIELGQRELTLEAGQSAELALDSLQLQPVWPHRTTLFTAAETAEPRAVDLKVRRGDQTDELAVSVAPQAMVEPLVVQVTDPWQRDLVAGHTRELRVKVKLALPAAQRSHGALRLRLLGRRSRVAPLSRELPHPQAEESLTLPVAHLDWGAYDLVASFADGAGHELLTNTQTATILPGGPQQIRVLNNLVSELLDAKAVGLLDQARLEFMNPRDGWVWVRAAGDATLKLGDELLLTCAGGKPTEAMRLLPAGRHTVEVEGKLTGLRIHAIPALFYNVYPSTPQIQPFGSNTWERLQQHLLANLNMIEGQVINTPEDRAWRRQGKLWIANVQAPGLIDKRHWSPEEMLKIWQSPRDWSLSEIDGIQSDEYYPGVGDDMVLQTARSVARLSEDPAFQGKLWIPFVVRMYGKASAELFMKTVLGAGWPFSIEVYTGEEPTAQEDLDSIRTRFGEVASAWDSAYPGCLRRAIFTPMYAYLPYCTSNRYPQADFRVHLDSQMQFLADDPAYFGLWGVQPYRSNYVDEEILDCMGRLLRHYCLEGKTDRLLSDPYELTYVKNPDFAAGLKEWKTAPADGGGITAGEFRGYGGLQGRYPASAAGDTFCVLQRSTNGPNVVRQWLPGLQAGRVYSLKVITADYGDLTGGVSRKVETPLSIELSGAHILPNRFSYPFRSARGPQPFTRDHPFWMTYHWLRFRAEGPAATLTLSDWAQPGEPGGPAGQQTMVSFIELQPVLERKEE